MLARRGVVRDSGRAVRRPMHDDAEQLLRRSIAHFEASGTYLPPEAFAVASHAPDTATTAGCFVGALRLFGRLVRPDAVGREVDHAASLSAATASAPKPTAASARLAKAHADLEARATALSERASTLRATARSQMASGDKRAALATLKRSKMVEKQAESATATSIQLESSLDALEAATVQRSVALALSSATKSAKRGTRGLLSKTETAVEAAEELMDVQRDVSSVLGELAVSSSNDYDEDDLANELAALMQEPDAAPSAADATVASTTPSGASLLAKTLFPTAPSTATSETRTTPVAEGALASV